MNFLKAVKASWFFYSLFNLLAILTKFETFWFYFLANPLTVLSLNQPGQAHCAVHLHSNETWRKCGENGWQEIVRTWDFRCKNPPFISDRKKPNQCCSIADISIKWRNIAEVFPCSLGWTIMSRKSWKKSYIKAGNQRAINFIRRFSKGISDMI